MVVPPAVKAALPFRVLPGAPLAILEYEELVQTPVGDRKVIMRLYEGSGPYAPVVALMKMYWDLEARLLGMDKELEEYKALLLAATPNPDKTGRNVRTAERTAIESSRGKKP